MWNDFVSLFTQMGNIPAILLTVGIVFCIIEMCLPGVGFFGISGGASVILGIIFMIIGDKANLGQVIIAILLIVLVLGVAGLIVVHSANKGLLSHSSIVNNNTALPVEFVDKDLEELIGKQGITTTECRPMGKAEIDNKEYIVVSEGDYLLNGVEFQVLSVQDSKLVVRAV